MKIDPLDKQFSEYVRKRAIVRCGGCERCGAQKPGYTKEDGSHFPGWKQLQCSHFWGRSRKSVRWDEDNAAGLCPACHMYVGANPAEHARWYKELIGERAYDLLEGRMRVPGMPDKYLLSVYYKGLISSLGEEW